MIVHRILAPSYAPLQQDVRPLLYYGTSLTLEHQYYITEVHSTFTDIREVRLATLRSPHGYSN